MAGWGLPYQGSKSAHAGRIYRLIRRSHPDCRHLWEPFTGGGALSPTFLPMRGGRRLIPTPTSFCALARLFRIAHAAAHRPTSQEELCARVADRVTEVTGSGDVAVRPVSRRN